MNTQTWLTSLAERNPAGETEEIPSEEAATVKLKETPSGEAPTADIGTREIPTRDINGHMNMASWV